MSRPAFGPGDFVTTVTGYPVLYEVLSLETDGLVRVRGVNWAPGYTAKPLKLLATGLKNFAYFEVKRLNVTMPIARIRIQLPTSCPERALFRLVALGLMPSGP